MRTVTELERAGVLLVQDGNHGAYRPLKDEILIDGTGYAHIRAADMSDDGTIDFSGAQRISETAYQRIRKGRARAGDVLFSHKGTVGRVARVSTGVPPFLCSPQTTFWRSLDDGVLDQGYLAAYLRSPQFRRQYEARMHETDMAPYVSLSTQRQLSIRLPPIAEQRRIAAVLGAVDDKIDAERVIIKRVDALVGAAHEFASRSGSPAKLGDLGIVVGGGTPKSKVDEYWSPPEVPWVTPKDMTALRGVPVIWQGERAISRFGLERSSAKLVPAGSVLYTSRATLGLIAVAQQPLTTNQGFITVVPRDDLGSAFVMATLRSVDDRIQALANGSTFLEVNKSNFKSVDCVIPDQVDVSHFRRIADPALRLAAAAVINARRLTEIRDLLLPKLVSGAIRVPATADDAEAVETVAEAVST